MRPHLDYCIIIYHVHVPVITDPFDSSINIHAIHAASMQSIESTQYQAALAVSGAWKGSNTSKLYEELGWESLTEGGTEDSFNFIKLLMTWHHPI